MASSGKFPNLNNTPSRKMNTTPSPRQMNTPDRAQRALPIVIDLDPQEDATFEVDESLYEPGPPMKRFPGAVCSNPTTPVRQRITASAPGSSKLASGKVLFSPRAKQTSLDKFVKSSTSSPQKHKRLKRQSSMTGFLSISVNNGPSNLSSSSNGRPKEPKVSKPSLALTTSSSPRSGAPVPEEFVFVSPIDQDQQLAIAASLKDQAAYTQPGTLSETGSSSSKRMQFSIPRWSGYSWTDGQQLAGPSGTQIINTEAASLSPSRLHPSRSEPSKVRPLIDIPASAVKQPDEDNNDLFWPGGSQPSSGVETPLARSPLKRSFSTMNQGVDMSSSRPVKQRSLSSSPDPLQTQLCSPATQLLHSASETPRKLVSTSRPASCKVTPTSHVINKPLVSKSPSKASMATSKVREDSDLEDYEPYFDDVKELWDLENMRNARAYDHAKEPMSVQRVEPVPKLIQNDERTNLRLSLVSGSSKKTGQPALVPRRPYLSIQARRFLRNAGNWDGFKMFDGIVIHVDFTPIEIELIRKCIYCYNIGILKAPSNEPPIRYIAYAVETLRETGEASLINCLRKAAQRLNGRAREDCIRFAQDCHANPDADLSQAQSYIRVHLPSASAASCRTPTSANILHLNRELALGRNNFIQSEASTSLKNNLINSIQPWKVVTGASSDILNLAWSPSGESFAFGSATLSDEYNRAGNLILGSLEPLKVKMLHGHQVPRLNPLPTQDPWLHSTVSSVGYSARSGILFSGSYDRYVRSWHPEAGVCLGNRLFADEVVTLVVHPIQDVVAVGCKDGSLELTTWDENGSYESSWKCTPLRTNNSREKLYPSCLSWQAGCQNKLIAGYDNLVQNSNAGSLVLFDGTTGQQFHKVQPGSTRHFDLCSHPYGLFAVACSARTSKSGSVRSHIRMFEQKSTGAVADFDADSCQVDINRVTISPCSMFVTSSGTDGSTICWDVRNPNNSLCKMQHGPEIVQGPDHEDTGVEFALWGGFSDYLYTGSGDGVVKVWDIKRANPHVKDLAQVNAQIMCGEFSPAKDMLLIGDASGTATILSTKGNLDTPPTMIPYDTTNDEEFEQQENEDDVPDDQKARYYARELLKSGKVGLRDGKCGYGVYKIK